MTARPPAGPWPWPMFLPERWLNSEDCRRRRPRLSGGPPPNPSRGSAERGKRRRRFQSCRRAGLWPLHSPRMEDKEEAATFTHSSLRRPTLVVHASSVAVCNSIVSMGLIDVRREVQQFYQERDMHTESAEWIKAPSCKHGRNGYRAAAYSSLVHVLRNR